MIRTKPKEYQQKVIDFCSPLPFAGIFSSYGSGKTLDALSIIENNGWKIVLVVSIKKSLQSTWEDEIKTHSNFFYVTLIGNSKEKFRTVRNAFRRYAGYTGSQRPTIIFLVNFDGVKGIFSVLTAIKPQAIFVDESTRIKSPEAIRSKVLWALGKASPRRFLLTGFPVTENLTEVYSQIKFLDLGETFGNSYAHFLSTYFKKKKGRWVPKRGAAKKIFDKIKDFCIFIPESAVKLPPKKYREVGLEPYEQQNKLLSQLRENMKVELSGVNINITSIYALLTKSLQICDGFIFDRSGRAIFLDTPKDEALLNDLEALGRQEKVLIFTTFIPTLKKLERILTRFGYGVLTLYGDTVNSGNVVRAFQNSGKYNVLISSIFSGDASITLSAARYGFYYSQWWSNDKRGNSEARIRRIGSYERFKSKSIIYTDYFIKGSVEDIVRGNIKSKNDLVKELKTYFT